MGAIHLDGGYEAAEAFLERRFRPLLDRLRQDGVSPAGTGDHKSALQEWLQARARLLPEYRLAGTTGPDHRKEFAVELRVGDRLVATGSGLSKKEAEREAARQALAVLKADPRIELNTAPAAALRKLTGVGAATARHIIAYRQEHGGFQRIEDLLNVRGIGEMTLRSLRPFIRIDAVTVNRSR